MRSKFDCLFDRRSGESPRLDILMTEMSGVIVCSPQRCTGVSMASWLSPM